MAVIKCESCNKYYNDSVFDSCPYPPTDGSGGEAESFDFEETTNIEDTTLVTQETTDLGKLASMDNEFTSGIEAGIDEVISETPLSFFEDNQVKEN